MQVVKMGDTSKFVVKCEDVDQTTMRSRLLVYDVSPENVGLYECIVDNGVGTADKREVNLYSSCKYFQHRIP